MGSEVIFGIVFLPVGLVAAYLAGHVPGGRRPFDLLGDMLLGMIGAYLGVRFLPALAVWPPGGIIGGFVSASLAALIGAIVVLILVRLIWRG